jgi:hypothetical protein
MNQIMKLLNPPTIYDHKITVREFQTLYKSVYAPAEQYVLHSTSLSEEKLYSTTNAKKFEWT